MLYEVTGRLAAVQDSQQILDLIVNSATALLGVEAAGLRLVDGDDLVIKARTESAAGLMSRVRLKRGESLSGYVLACGEAVIVEDLAADTRYDPNHKRAAVEMGFRGFLGVPLRVTNRVIGVLTVFTTRRRRFQDEDIALLSMFADQASLAIDRDRMLQEARDQAARLRALARLKQVVTSSLDIGDVLQGIAVAAAELTGAPSVAFWVANESRRELTLRAMSDDRTAADFPGLTLRFGEGVAGWVAANRRPLPVSDVFTDSRALGREWFARHGLKSVYATPIVFHDSLLGVLAMFGAAAFTLDDADREVLGDFVTQAAVAIRNARLYEEVREAGERLAQRSRELELLNRMGELLHACVSEDEAYAVIGRFAADLFPGYSGAVFVISASRNLVESRASWPDVPALDSTLFKPDDCLALRRGRMHVMDTTANPLRCTHVPDPAPDCSVCVPLVAQGESLGVLHLASPGVTGPWPDAMRRLAGTVADQAGLAVANLKLRETLRTQSIRDPLTGLFNRRYLEETLERELRRAERSRGKLSVVMLDLDRFKEFNDTFGHDAGDLLLRDFGRLLPEIVRGGDVVCRYGGEEFVIVLPEADVEVTRQRAERIRDAVRRLVVSHRGEPIGSVTVSAGVAGFPNDGTTATVLLQAADAALYRAKNGGRDRVVLASGGEAVPARELT